MVFPVIRIIRVLHFAYGINHPFLHIPYVLSDESQERRSFAVGVWYREDKEVLS